LPNVSIRDVLALLGIDTISMTNVLKMYIDKAKNFHRIIKNDASSIYYKYAFKSNINLYFI